MYCSMSSFWISDVREKVKVKNTDGAHASQAKALAPPDRYQEAFAQVGMGQAVFLKVKHLKDDFG